LPALLPIMVPLFFLGVVLKEPQSTLSIVLSFFPPFTPTLMLIRLGLPDGAPLWQGWVALAGLIVFAALVVWIASRIFRVALLVQGQSPKIKDLVRWAIKA
jgi:ABC-2 type transport system permease protein